MEEKIESLRKNHT